MLFVLGVIRGDDDDRSLDLLAFSYRSGSITLRRISVPCPLPLAPFRSVATDDDDRFSAARSRGPVLPRRESRREASEGERSGKSINQNNTACGCRLASRQSRGRSSAKGLTLTFPSSSISALDVSSSFHHHIIIPSSIIDLVVPSLDIQDRPALSHTLFS